MNTALDDVVPANGKQSLREAITRANTQAGADVIVVPAGVFKIALPGKDENGNLTGDLDIHDTLTVQGAGAGLTVIDGQQLDRVFDVSGTAPSSIKVVLQGMTIRNGWYLSGLSLGGGGGILVGNADLVVRDCVVTLNRVFGNGGGISDVGAPGTGDVTVVRTTVSRNLSDWAGGGISVSSLTVKDSTVRRNIAIFGGGIHADAVTVTNSTISGNTAGLGGGIYAEGLTTLTHSTVTGNTASTDGGGIYANGLATLTHSTVTGNTAGRDGGGIVTMFTTLTNSTISGNTAIRNGGGISPALSPSRVRR